MSRRPGLSLIELLIAVAIIGILIGLLLGAVQKVRLTARRTALQNQIRQLSLAVLQIEGNQGAMPIAHDFANRGSALIPAVMTHFGCDNSRYQDRDSFKRLDFFVSALDPSYDYYPDKPYSPIGSNDNGVVSFGFNHLVFGTRHNTIDDGRSNTLMCSERYARCGIRANVVLWVGLTICTDEFGQPVPLDSYSMRWASFAEWAFGDVLPVYNAVDRKSHGSIPDVTFQVAPRPDVCNPRLLQASTTSGLVVALMDGSVRTISPGIDPAVYWSSMTPDKGEVVNLD